MRFFLDANILFSAAWKDNSAAERLLQLGQAGFVTLVTSKLAIEEARRNLHEKRAARLPRLAKLLSAVNVVPDPDAGSLKHARAHGLPDKDIPILAAAIAARANALVTGDRLHFGSLYGRRVQNVTVITLTEALSAIANSSRVPVF